MNGRNDQEWVIPDYDEEIENVKKLISSCKRELKANKVEVIPHFNEIVNRELDAIIDILVKIDHFHASARCVRAALELTMINLYRYFFPGGRPTDASFWKKYGLKRLTHRTKSPLLRLVGEGVIDDVEFGLFCETYGNLSGYVHHRVTYELCHILPEVIKSEQYYAAVVRYAGRKGRIARIVKSSLIKYSLEPALETLLRFIRKHKDIQAKHSFYASTS